MSSSQLIGAIGELEFIPCECEDDVKCERCKLIKRIKSVNKEINEMLGI